MTESLVHVRERPSPRWTSVVVGMWALGVALLLVFSGIGISSATPVVVEKAPYTGATLYNHIQTKRVSGCSSFAHDPIPGSFNVTTGLASVVSKIGAQVCSGSNGTALLLGFVGASNITIHVPSTGRYNLSAFWSVLAAVTITVSHHGSPSANVSGFVELHPNMCVFDLVTGNLGCTGAHAFGRVTSTTNLSSNISSSFAMIWQGWLLRVGHTYEIRTYVLCDLGAGAFSPAPIGSSVSVTLDLHSRGYGAYLRSVTVVH